MNDLTGTKLEGRYLLVKLLGEGGMADVYLADDLLEQRQVGVKILKSEYRNNAELVRRFKNESRAISVLNHTHIVKVYDVNVSDKVPYIVMEYIKGITLKEYIEQRGEPLTYKETLHFTMQILQALQHAHDKGVVHRDIKPQNIMLTEDGNLKVMDFGIARLARSEMHTATDQAIGSVHYISPEQAKGDETDPRADLYSVGIMMYEMLSGKLPFESDNAVSIAVAQISQDAVPLARANPSVPEGLCEIVGRAMMKDPRRRYQSALEMMRDIEEFKQDPSIKFEYDYLDENEHKRYINRVMKDTQGQAPRPRNGANRNGVSRNGKKPAKKRKRVSILVPAVLGITVAFVGVCLLLSWNMFKNSGNPLFSEYEDIELPDFKGMQISEVQQMLKKDPYKYLRLEISEETNPETPAGQVISQNPTSSNTNKKMVKANQRVYLTVSEGIVDIKIPDVAGMSRGEAVKEILRLGLRPYAQSVVDNSVPTGTVIGTEPSAGSVVQNTPGTVITIKISSERRNYDRTVPNVVGIMAEDAVRVLQGNDLGLGLQIEEFSDEPVGTIIAQSPTAGTVRSIGGSVNITVSKGPEAPPEPPGIQVPDLRGQSLGTAQAILGGLKLGSAVGEVRYDPSQPEGTVVDQSVGIGGSVPEGTTVLLAITTQIPPASSSTTPTDPTAAGTPPAVNPTP